MLSSPVQTSSASTAGVGGGTPFSMLRDTSSTGMNYGGMNNMTNTRITTNNNNSSNSLNHLYGGSSFNNISSSSPIAFTGLGMMGATTTSMMMPSAPLTTNLASIQVSQINGPTSAGVVDDDDVASGFVMGGTAGSGLEPLGTAPAAPPPPPPPASYW
jgi:hypothetical protein